jgi:rare lipoprotein A (peptidoglycan hydrolase)
VSARLAQRELALAGLALLAVAVAVAVASRRSHGDETLPQPVGRWQTAVAGIRASGGDFGRKTACGIVLRPETIGVSHGVLPCGAKIFLRNGDRTVMTQVIDRGPPVAGRVFDLTEALAARLDVKGNVRLRWAYAGEP